MKYYGTQNIREALMKLAEDTTKTPKLPQGVKVNPDFKLPNVARRSVMDKVYKDEAKWHRSLEPDGPAAVGDPGYKNNKVGPVMTDPAEIAAERKKQAALFDKQSKALRKKLIKKHTTEAREKGNELP